MIPSIIILLTAGGLVYFILYGLYTFALQPLLGLIKNNTGYPFVAKIDSGIEIILLNNNPYFQSIDASLKPLFIYRVSQFMQDKEFIGKEGIMVTKEMEILISATAIQVTFGLESFILDSFKKIYIYPNQFFSKVNQKYHIGEVSLSGAISISWEDFKKGVSDLHDNRNVGLHEIAHALRFNKFKGNEIDSFFVEYFDKFLAIGKEEFFRIKSGEKSFLRPYAGANYEEFFAVCVEYFFESPKQMKEKLPELYRHLCILLNQDPASLSIIGVRETLCFKESAVHEKAIYTSPLTLSWRIAPYVFGFMLLLLLFKSYYLHSPLSNISSFVAWMVSTCYIAAGGFTISKRFKKFTIYPHHFCISYPLNPVVKETRLNYNNIVSMTIRTEEYPWLDYRQVIDDMVIVYSDGIQVKSNTFSIDQISISHIETIAAFLKKKKVLIKILSRKWSIESINKREAELDRVFKE